MPVNPTYPGVYIQEVDSGSRVVSGVATSITAFVGRAPQGPANTATTVFSYGEFQQLFGGRASGQPMTYAVEDFFNNGGSQAVIVRVCCGPPSGTPATVDLVSGDPKIALTSALKGSIANTLKLRFAFNPASKDYSLIVQLGSIELGRVDGVTPATLPISLKSMTTWFGMSGMPSADQATALLKGLDEKNPTKELAFAGATDVGTPQPPAYQAGDLKISLVKGGAWADKLALNVVRRGTNFVFRADHPLFSQPYEIPFTAWGQGATPSGVVPKAGQQGATTVNTIPVSVAPSGGVSASNAIGASVSNATSATVSNASGATLSPSQGSTIPGAPASTGLADLLRATGLFTVVSVPQMTPDKFILKSVPLTRIPDSSGASAALNTFGPLVIMANSPGSWGDDIAISFEQGKVPAEIVARYADYGISDLGKFAYINVFYPYRQGKGPVAETIGPVYLGPEDAPCRIDHMLNVNSQYVAAQPPVVPVDIQTAWLDPQNPIQLGKGGDGDSLTSDIIVGNEAERTGIYALEQVDLFNILVIPPDSILPNGDDDMKSIYQNAASYSARRRAILIADPLDSWGSYAHKSQFDKIMPTDYGIGELTTRRSVFTYFPRVKKLDPEHANREDVFSASGIIAGIFASTDVRRGVWKAPAGIEAGMNGVTGLEHRLTDMQNGVLNQIGVNVLRDFPVIGKVIWGSRTLAGADALSDDYKYLPVRRLTNFIEESLYRATKFAVFEPNAEPLWSQLRLTIGAFMADLNRQGAFYRYSVACDDKTTTQFDIDRGRVNVIVAFAPVKPAEFVILTIQQLAGQTAA